ncbi:MAG: serine/threonine-protein kinase [Acidobacteriota bacterium]
MRTIDTARWQQVEELFHAALERPVAERAAYLDAACRDRRGRLDEVLHEEVDSLLGAHEGPEAFDEEAASKLAARLASEETALGGHDPLPAQRIGRYRLLEVLGQGGMGTVYLAEQSEPLHRQVALKLMSWRGEPGVALRRFELEREAMARMSHPTIAQVYDAGSTARGQPYVVLEHIPGPPITTYCDENGLDLRARIELLLTVCDGVRHAHERAVIHRDLKPSNILVREVAGAPLAKIIDFGIAKALEPWDTVSDTPTTKSGLRVGSPSYMSPEALATGGQGLDTRSDVYSLGVVLCELLVGVRPFSHPLKQFMMHGSEPSKLNSLLDTARPSRRLLTRAADERHEIARRRGLDENALLHTLRDELDWVVLRAIAPDPEDRYSVGELAADLRRWLDGEPLEARPSSMLYRARKAIRRHAVLFVAGCLLALTVIGFSIRSSILYARAENARLQAEELVGFMLDDLSTQLEPMGRLDLLESVSRESLDYFESSGASTLQEAGDRPASALRQIGRVLSSRGDLDAALEAYERAWRIDTSRQRRAPDDPSVVLDLAEDLRLLADVHEARDELPTALEHLVEAETIVRDLVERDPDTARTGARLALAQTLSDLAGVERLLGEPRQAIDRLSEVLSMTASLRRDDPTDAEVLHVVGTAHYQLGLVWLYSIDDPQRAIEHLEAGVDVYRALAASQPEASLWRFRLAVLLGQGKTAAYREVGRLDDARAANAEALALYEVLVREDPTNGRWAHALGWELVRRGMLATLADEVDTAVSAYRRAVEVHQSLLDRTASPHAGWLEGLAMAQLSLAEARAARGQYALAIDDARAALASRRILVADADDQPYYLADLGEALLLIAEILVDLGAPDVAREPIAELLAIHADLAARDYDDPFTDQQVAGQVERLAQLHETLDGR